MEQEIQTASTNQPSANIESNSSDPPSSSEVQPVASSSKGEPAPKPPKPQSRVGNFQPSVPYLKRLGIKVRDFAFESTLPPVPTYYLQKRQIQPDTRRPLQRTSTEPDDSSQQPSQGTQNLGRRPTEPVITPERPLRAGQGAFANLADELDSSQQSNLHADFPTISQIPSILPQSTTDITMNPVNAEASHTWNAGNTSHSQSSQPRMSSGAAGSESGSAADSQPTRGLRHEEAPSTLSRAMTMSFPSSPLTPLPSSPASSPPNGIRVTPLTLSNQLSTTLPIRTTSTYELRTPGTPRVLATSTRYFLRKRPSPSSSSATSPNNNNSGSGRPSKRARKFPVPELTRTNSTSAKSSRAQKKGRDKSISSSSRTLRNSGVVSVSEGKGKRKKC